MNIDKLICHEIASFPIFNISWCGALIYHQHLFWRFYQMFIWRHGGKSTESNKNIYKIMLHSPCIGIYFDWIQWSSRTDFSLHPSKSSLSLLCHTFYSALEYAGSPNFPFSIDTIDSKKRIPHRYMANLSLEISDIPMCTDTRYLVYFELLTISNIRWDSFESTCL